MIKGTEGLSVEQINDELSRGGKFVVYEYCISCFVMTFKRGSEVFFIKAGENRLKHGVIYSLISLVLGWWGIPWGPIYTVGTVVNNLRGGKDVTRELVTKINQAM